MPTPDYYAILGVDRNASQDDIRSAFLKLARQYHPDRLVNESDKKKEAAEDMIREVNAANLILSDVNKRLVYNHDNPTAGLPKSTGSQPTQQPTPSQQPQKSSAPKPAPKPLDPHIVFQQNFLKKMGLFKGDATMRPINFSDSKGIATALTCAYILGHPNLTNGTFIGFLYGVSGNEIGLQAHEFCLADSLPPIHEDDLANLVTPTQFKPKNWLDTLQNYTINRRSHFIRPNMHLTDSFIEERNQALLRICCLNSSVISLNPNDPSLLKFEARRKQLIALLTDQSSNKLASFREYLNTVDALSDVSDFNFDPNTVTQMRPNITPNVAPKVSHKAPNRPRRSMQYQCQQNIKTLEDAKIDEKDEELQRYIEKIKEEISFAMKQTNKDTLLEAINKNLTDMCAQAGAPRVIAAKQEIIRLINLSNKRGLTSIGAAEKAKLIADALKSIKPEFRAQALADGANNVLTNALKRQRFPFTNDKKTTAFKAVENKPDTNQNKRLR
jgi:curved DNA-binding protein CbpA